MFMSACAAWCPGRVLFGLMFFPIKPNGSTFTLKIMVGYRCTVQGRLKGKIKHLMSEQNSQLQQLCFYTSHLTCTNSPHLLSSESDLTRSQSAQAPHLVDFDRSNCFTLVASRRLLV